MSFQQDYIMRQIENMVQFIARTILGKDAVKYEVDNEAVPSADDILYNKTRELIAKKEISKAEELLCASTDFANERDAELALDFYQMLNLLSDEELEKCGFSRSKISDGLVCIAEKCGIPYLPF